MGYAVGQRKPQGLGEQEKQEWQMKWEQEGIDENGGGGCEHREFGTKQREGRFWS